MIVTGINVLGFEEYYLREPPPLIPLPLLWLLREPELPELKLELLLLLEKEPEFPVFGVMLSLPLSIETEDERLDLFALEELPTVWFLLPLSTLL